jgi:hypothetical protein
VISPQKKLVEEQLELAVRLKLISRHGADLIKDGTATGMDFYRVSERLVRFEGFSDLWRFCFRSHVRSQRMIND